MSKFCCFQRHNTKEDKIILKPKLKLELEIEVELKIAHELKLRLELKFKLKLEKSLKIPHSTENPVFSLNFSSAVKGSFIAGKAKDMHHRGAIFRGQGVSGVRDMAPPLLGNLGAKFSEMPFPHFKTYFTQIGRSYLYTTILNDRFQ